MNKNAIAKRLEDGFSINIPSEVGLYYVVCDENSNIADAVAITNLNGILIVHDRELGKIPLDHYHLNLIDIMWKKLA